MTGILIHENRYLTLKAHQTPADDTKSCVIYGTLYGNTEKIARALTAGLKDSWVETTCINQTAVNIDELRQFGLICIGAPTEAFSAYKPTKDFLQRLTGDLSGKFGFTFDTKIDNRFSGTASKLIEKQLTDFGLRIIAPRESAIVFTEGGTKGARLKEGKEARYVQIGRNLGSSALSAELAIASPPA